MRLNEFTRPRHSDVGDILAKAGFDKIGVGYYADVYSRPTDDYVLKIVSPRDQAYQAFYRFCQTRSSPHLPVFRGKFMNITDDYCAIRMERLTPLPTESNIIHDIQCMSMIFQCNCKENIQRNWKLSNAVMEWAENNKEITNLLIEMATVLGDKHCEDINMWNVMLRGDVYVFIDPVG